MADVAMWTGLAVASGLMLVGFATLTAEAWAWARRLDGPRTVASRWRLW